MKNIEKIMKKYGRQITAVTEKGTGIKSFKCFVQPLRYKNKMYLEGGEFVPELFRPIDIDVLMLPVGGKYTVDGNTAYRYVEQLKPSLVLPMHFKTPYCNFAIDGADVFLARFNKENVFYADILQPELYLKKGCTRVAVMNFKA